MVFLSLFHPTKSFSGHWILSFVQTSFVLALKFRCTNYQQLLFDTSEHLANSWNIFPTISQVTGEEKQQPKFNMSWYRCTVSVWTNYKSRVNPYCWGMAESLVDFHPWQTNSLELSTSLPFCLCWPCRVQLIDKGFCPCHQGLMSLCQLPGSPVPHSALLFFFSSIPDRSLSPSLLFLTPPLPPIPSTLLPRETFIPTVVPAGAAYKLLSQSELLL